MHFISIRLYHKLQVSLWCKHALDSEAITFYRMALVRVWFHSFVSNNAISSKLVSLTYPFAHSIVEIYIIFGEFRLLCYWFLQVDNEDFNGWGNYCRLQGYACDTGTSFL